jgi:hypothetical protein
MEEHIINDSNIPINQVNEESEKPNKKKVRYTSAHLKAQNKYRENNREKYNEAQRLLYEKKIQEEEWQKHYLERSRINNKKYREKRKEALIESGEYVEKKRGRPHKRLECIIKDEHTDHKVYNVKDYFIKITDIEDELLDNVSEIKQKTIINKQEQFEKINELEEENNLLTENLIQSEERIKKLEEEIELLKNDEKINELEEENKLLTETLLQSEERIKKLEEEIELLKMKKIKK